MKIVKIAGYILLSMLLAWVALSSGSKCIKAQSLYIYFSSKRDGYYGLYRSDSKKSQLIFNSKDILENLPNIARYQMAYSVSQDERYIAFNALSEELNMDIFLLDLKTGHMHNLTKDSSTDTLPVFSHSGKWIAYLSHEKGGRQYDNIFIVSKDGRVKKRLTRDFIKITTPSFSPDDRQILFVKYLPFHSAISVVDLETGWVQELTTFAYSNKSPSFSSDGKKIVYASDCKGTFDIWVMNRDGSDKRLLYQSPGLEYDPHFTADDRRVYFVSDWVEERKRGKIGSAILAVNIDGTDPVNLIPKKYMKKNFFCFYPRMTSNGRLLSFQGKVVKRFRSTNYTVYILDVEKKALRKVVKDGFNNTEPLVYVR